MEVIQIEPIIWNTLVQFARRKELIMYYSLPILLARRGRSIMNCMYLLLACKERSTGRAAPSLFPSRRRFIMGAMLSIFASRERNAKSPSHGKY